MYESTPTKIFIVEDDPAYSKFLEYVLSLNPDFDIEVFATGKDCINNLHKNPEIITLDYTLPDYTGEDVLAQVKSFNQDIHVIIISAQEKIGTAVKLLKLGAYDYISKDGETKDRLLNSINNAKNNVSLIREVDQLKEKIKEKFEFGKVIIGTSPSMKQTFLLMEKAVKTNIIVSITGETGTGKEMVAKAVHYNSSRRKKSFVAVNIAAIPKELIESELFGHEKGAFTGAAALRIGKFEEAEGGTLLLDEIGEMDLNLQAKLLRVLQEKEVTRIGSNKIIKLDVRIIVATHRDLGEEVKKGNFREDLYYRLLGLPIHLPPLRERGNDIIMLSKYFLNEFIKNNHMSSIRLGSDACEKLLQYHFPGNVRELKSVIELAAVMADDNEILPDNITFNSIHKEAELMNTEMTLRDYTFRIIQHFLDKYDNDIPVIARKLDIGKSSIYRYIKEMEVENNGNLK